MSKYTSGELAKLCGVTVRTVQYYDNRNILIPSELSEGGRRLYSEEDVRRLKIICFLREAGLSIDTIGQILKEEYPHKVIDLMLEEQKCLLLGEIEQRQDKLEILTGLQRELKHIRNFTVESIGDIAQIMETKKKLTKLHKQMLAVGLIMDAIEAGTLVYWIMTGIWWPFALGMAIVVALGIGISAQYYTHVEYLCPECHKIFVPKFKESFWARHTPRTRKLSCIYCGHKGFCVETYRREEKNA